MHRIFSFVIIEVLLLVSTAAFAGDRYNFNSGWLVKVGDAPEASGTHYDDTGWQKVTLPYSFNQTEAYGKHIAELTDTVAWYRKHFVLPENMRNAKKFFIEFEGVRFGAHCFLNGKELGWGENGVMAFGFDLTPYITGARSRRRKPAAVSSGTTRISSATMVASTRMCGFM